VSLWHLAWRYLWSRSLVTLLTLAGVALGCGLISSVLTLHRETSRAFQDEAALFDLVVGAKGSPLQLVLSSVYHLDIPTGNIPYSRFEALAADPRVAAAIPIALGDNHKGYRIVGTTPGMAGAMRRGTRDREPQPLVTLREGRWVGEDFDAVLGAEVAAATGLRVGDTFAGTHGIVALAGSEEHDNFPYTVVGILEPGGVHNDRAIFTSLEAVWAVHDYDEALHTQLFSGDDEEEEEDAAEDDGDAGGFLFGGTGTIKRGREVTAVLVQLRTPAMRLWMIDQIRNETESMAAAPLMEILKLTEQILRPMQRTLMAVAWLVVVVSALTILTTLYQSAERRRRDLAIMRALGAHPWESFALVLLEAVFITTLGIALGWLLGHGGVALGAGLLQRETGLAVAPWVTSREELRAFGVVLASGVVAGLLPALLAYRRPPASDLTAA
jgi:putative ABC transport system permease protein